MHRHTNLFALVFFLLTACMSQAKPEESKQLVDRHEIFTVHRKIAEIQKQTDDSNRCANEREMDRLFKSVCSDCFDGWGMTSYSLDEQLEDCQSDKIHSSCLQLPQWIAIQTSSCGNCGIHYLAVNKPKNFLANFNENSTIPNISCEKFYDSLKRMQKYCSKCIKEKKTN